MQIVHSSWRGSHDIEHVGSAHDDAQLEALKTVAAQRLAAGQGMLDLDLGLDAVAASGPLQIVSSRAGHLWDALSRAYDTLGFSESTGGDAVFRQLVLARIIEPTSKLAQLREVHGLAGAIGEQPKLAWTAEQDAQPFVGTGRTFDRTSQVGS